MRDIAQSAAMRVAQDQQIAFAAQQQRLQLALQILGMNTAMATVAKSQAEAKTDDSSYFELREKAIRVLSDALDRQPESELARAG